MPLKKAIESPATGADANFHIITSYSVDLDSGYSAAAVSSYHSQAAQAAGKQPMHTWHITLSGVPPQDKPALAWLEAELAHAEIPPADDPSLSLSPERWAFAGAERI
ncbi:hypothetical protein [Cupriavidus malaysiensis]|uniref:Uncharacterized protein n=1 Tax=Cupriavidus malaysiensis TaxID=367825 RepID=A0ABM6F3Q6_9BURK|nr:hypothetical protein [Cupriavidus malaysiensis]AOZ05972.1 hypothetical protein BKK80_09120 [Cupriavidus malaysiensis]